MELNIKGASKDEILKKLFLSTLYLSAFTFGGGYVIRYFNENKIC